MGERQQAAEGARVITLPTRLVVAEPDAELASLIQVLQDQLVLAREGKLRSVAVATVSTDGKVVDTHWSCEHKDITSLIGKLTVLTHDLMAARN
ncbi:hypothetical protein [Methylobacterium radiodurans]|uniref:hypothetical protein n=1 Tax=Methylobacterium radiodurans TaxID=2202828 RepID=UPI001FEC6D34|nr:hypothetical protein [Methylobacterium radiodurans]